MNCVHTVHSELKCKKKKKCKNVLKIKSCVLKAKLLEMLMTYNSTQNRGPTYLGQVH